jgi:hypothetical protein
MAIGFSCYRINFVTPDSAATSLQAAPNVAAIKIDTEE